MPASGSASIAAARRTMHVAGHQAVGVEHQHVIVMPAPAASRNRRCCRPCDDGSSAGGGSRTARSVRAGSRRSRKARSSATQASGIGGVGQDEVVERARRARWPRRIRGSPRGPRRCAPSARCRPASRRRFGSCRTGGRPAAGPRRLSRTKEAEDGAREGDGDPGEVDREEREQEPLQDGGAAHRHHLVHLVGAVGRQQQGAAEDEQTRASHGVRFKCLASGRRSSAPTSAAATGSACRAVIQAASRSWPRERGHVRFGGAYGVQR